MSSLSSSLIRMRSGDWREATLVRNAFGTKIGRKRGGVKDVRIDGGAVGARGGWWWAGAFLCRWLVGA